MIDDKIGTRKETDPATGAIDAELAALFGLAEHPKRGRPSERRRPE